MKQRKKKPFLRGCDLSSGRSDYRWASIVLPFGMFRGAKAKVSRPDWASFVMRKGMFCNVKCGIKKVALWF